MTEEKQYWLACYPDEAKEIPGNGVVGGSHFLPSAENGKYELAFLLLDSPRRSAAIMKNIQGRRFVGSTPVHAENGKTYFVPNYDTFDSVACVKVDVAAIPEELSPSLSEQPIPGSYRLSLSEPTIPASCVSEIVELSLSDDSVPDIDELLRT